MAFQVPILMIVFNRKDTTERVFESVRKIKPSKLYVAADGPRESRKGEDQKCNEVREIFTHIDWDCDVKLLFSDENQGCHTAVPNALDWFFSHEEKGIILEDDCLPDDSFYSFCAELLERFKDDTRVMMISGDNFSPNSDFSDKSYLFSQYAFIWGWATWKRAWVKFKEGDANYSDFRAQKRILDVFPSLIERFYWGISLDNKFLGYKVGWDTKWIYALLSNNGLSVIPAVNLVKNIGFGIEATATKTPAAYACQPSNAIQFPLKHPLFVLPHHGFDRRVFFNVFMSIIDLRTIATTVLPRFGIK